MMMGLEILEVKEVQMMDLKKKKKRMMKMRFGQRCVDRWLMKV